MGADVATLRGRAIRSKDTEIRDQFFPDAEARMWDRQRFHGFTTVPRTMPLIQRAMNELAEKGKPLAETYFALWCATWDNAFVRLGRAPDIAYAAGFTGQRGVRTFYDRVRRLAVLGFVDVRDSAGQAMGLAFLPNPHVVLLRLWECRNDHAATPELLTALKGLTESTYNAFLERAIDVGCNDVERELARLAAAQAPKSTKARSVASAKGKTKT